MVAALAVVNALGEVLSADGRVLAGVRDREEEGPAWPELLLEPGSTTSSNTTLVVVATDADLDRAQCRKLAEISHDGLALSIRPVHTLADGDTVFALSKGNREVDPLVLGVGAVEVVRRAVARAVGGD